MADSKISALSDGTTPQDTDAFVVSRSGANNKLSWSELRTGFVLSSGRVVLTSGDITGSATSFIDLTGVTVTLTTKGHPCLIGFTCIAAHSVSPKSICFDVAIDGTRQGGAAGLVQAGVNSGANANPSFTYLTSSLSAASHTFQIQWIPQGATATVFASSTAPAAIWVAELPI